MQESTLVSRLVSVVDGAVGGAEAVRTVDPETGACTTLTYRHLAARAGGIAAAVRDTVGTSSTDSGSRRVGVLLESGSAAVTAIVGVLGAGAAYVPLDPSYPRPRLTDWARRADLAAIVTTASSAATCAAIAPDVPTVLIDSVGEDELRPPAHVRPDDAAYLLATSGSTGVPKGIAQTHRNVLAYADNQIHSLGIGADDRISLLASLSFDAAVPDLYSALLTGATLCPVDMRGAGVGAAVDALAALDVSVLHATPTVLRYLVAAMGDRTLPGVRTVLAGGEAATHDDLHRLAGRFAPGAVLVNGYGATEATFSAHQSFPLDEPAGTSSGVLPIGRPLPGFEFELRGTDGSPASDEGEIVVRSRHVAPGYWRDADLTAERFGVDPDGVATYRSGDRGRRLADGTYVCLGRTDRQLKVRGFRIEPAEVEAALAAVPGVAQAVVTGHGERLVAYVRGEVARPEAADIRGRLATQLPDHLVPDLVVGVDELPTTPTGKIDILALPDPAPAAPSRRAESDDGSGNDTGNDTGAGGTLERVRAVWGEVLGSPPPGRDYASDQGFFDAGGTSLTAGLLQVALSAEFGRDIRLADVFEHPTIADQARLLTSAPDTAPRTPAYAADPADAGPMDDEGPMDDDAIAIVGMAGRLPGATDLDAFWRLLRGGGDAIHDYTDDDLDALGIGSALRSDPDFVPAGGRVDDVTDFDAAFFRMSQEEAERTDPQHRLFLEAGWAALEDAGCVPDRYDGRIGVFTAASANRYFLFHLLGNPALGVTDPDDWEGLLAGAPQGDHLPGQVAYRLGLTGPAVSVQCACSSSLAAVALAAQSLLDLRCDLALAGGVNVTWPRYRYRPGGLGSPDGRCRAFDAAADGAGFSSGVGVVALKRLADAEADGDHVHAVIRGWAMTNDGAARAGFAVPGASGQAAAIAEALAVADVHPDEVGLVEAHGSGTPLGDAIEVSALTQVFADGGAPSDQRIALGSVKTNIGHLDAAAGIAGLLKAVLSVRHGVIPANVHFRSPNPELALDRSPFHVPAVTRTWEADGARIAAVNSFGVGGTNVHLIVAAHEPVDVHTDGDCSDPDDPSAPIPWVLPLSAPDPAALREIADAVRRHLIEHPDLRPQDVTRTLTLGRRWWTYRAVASGRTLAAAADDLARIAAGVPPLASTGMPADFVRWSGGEDVDLHDLVSGRTVPLPTYPFQRRRAWIEPAGGVLV